jgi:hypothetical protein
VAADAVGADDHQRAHRIEHGALDLVVAELDALLCGLGADLLARAFALAARGHSPVSAAVRSSPAPAASRRAPRTRPLRLALGVDRIVAEAAEELPPIARPRCRDLA